MSGGEHDLFVVGAGYLGWVQDQSTLEVELVVPALLVLGQYTFLSPWLSSCTYLSLPGVCACVGM